MSAGPHNQPSTAPPLLAERYRLDGVVYSDTSSVAYRAHDQLLNRTVTVELLQAQHATNPAYRSRLIDKARSAALMSLPNVAAVYDQGMVNDRPFLVREELLGPTVAEAAPLPADQAINVVSAVADTVRAAATQQQPLLPITPQTVRVDAEGRAQILDFGLDQPPTNPAQAVAALGRLLQAALANSNEGHQVTPVRAIAEQAVAGRYTSVDGLVAELRRVQQRANSVTTVIPRMPPTIQIEDPHDQRVVAPAPRAQRQAAQPAVVAQPPAVESAPRSRRLLWPIVGAITLLVLLVGGMMLRGGNDTPSDEPATAGGGAAASSAAAPSTAGGESPASGPTYIVAARGSDTIRVREGPGVNFQQIASLRNGTTVQVVEGPRPADNYNWVRIRAGNVDGWCILEGLRKQ